MSAFTAGPTVVTASGTDVQTSSAFLQASSSGLNQQLLSSKRCEVPPPFRRTYPTVQVKMELWSSNISGQHNRPLVPQHRKPNFCPASALAGTRLNLWLWPRSRPAALHLSLPSFFSFRRTNVGSLGLKTLHFPLQHVEPMCQCFHRNLRLCSQHLITW